jgi:hypothetical protein
MDERLTRALEFANYRATLQQQKENLKLKISNLLTYSINGGTFKINQELLAYVMGLLSRSITETILFDINFVPVQISDLNVFFEEIFKRYNESSLEYLKEYEKLKKARNVRTLVNLDDLE